MTGFDPRGLVSGWLPRGLWIGAVGLAIAGLPQAWAGFLSFPGYEKSQGAAPAVSLDGDGALVLGDGRRIRLAGIELPRPRPGDPASKSLAGQAEDALKILAEGSPLTLWMDRTGGPDRWGRLPAQAVTADGTWIQGELLRRGLARVLTTVEDGAAAPALLAAEEPARMAGIGLWADNRYAVRRPGEAYRFMDSVQVFEGVVRSVNVTKNAVYLNFGEDRRRWLGVRVRNRLRAGFADDPASWTGRCVLVRGWVGKSIGPLIDLDHTGQIAQGTPAGTVDGGGAERE